jgi:hypothetical protein
MRTPALTVSINLLATIAATTPRIGELFKWGR